MKTKLNNNELALYRDGIKGPATFHKILYFEAGHYRLEGHRGSEIISFVADPKQISPLPEDLKGLDFDKLALLWQDCDGTFYGPQELFATNCATGKREIRVR